MCGCAVSVPGSDILEWKNIIFRPKFKRKKLQWSVAQSRLSNAVAYSMEIRYFENRESRIDDTRNLVLAECVKYDQENNNNSKHHKNDTVSPVIVAFSQCSQMCKWLTMGQMSYVWWISLKAHMCVFVFLCERVLTWKIRGANPNIIHSAVLSEWTNVNVNNVKTSKRSVVASTADAI